MRVKDYAVLIAVMFVVAMWLLTPSIVKVLVPEIKAEDLSAAARGQYGDMYGIVTSLFSGLTIIGLIYTIVLQREDIGISSAALKKQHEELELNREELRLNREELKQTRKEFQRQNANLKRQRFESSFFSMVEIHLNNLRSINYSRENGTRAVQQFINTLTHQFQPYLTGDGHQESRINVYNDVFINGQFAHIVSPYLKSLTAIYEITKYSSLSSKAEKRYIKILKAYISSIEVEFLFYHNSFRQRDDLSQKELQLLNQLMIDSDLISEAKSYIRSKRGMDL